MSVSGTSRRRDRKAIDRTKQALNAYAMTGDKTILQELQASFQGGFGKNRGINQNLSNTIKSGVKAFITKELANTTTLQPTVEGSTASTLEHVATQGEAAASAEAAVAENGQAAAQALGEMTSNARRIGHLGLITQPGTEDTVHWYRTVEDTMTGLVSNRYNGGSFASNNLKLSKSYANSAREKGIPTKTYDQTIYLTDKILEATSAAARIEDAGETFLYKECDQPVKQFNKERGK